MADSTLRQRLKRLRESAGLSQNDLGVKAGVTGQTVWRIEGGSGASRDTLVGLARALGVTPFFLEHGVEEPRAGTVLPVSLEAYLRETSALTEEQIGTIGRIHQAFEAELRLAGLLSRGGLEDIPGEPRAAHPEPPPKIEPWPPPEGEVE